MFCVRAGPLAGPMNRQWSPNEQQDRPAIIERVDSLSLVEWKKKQKCLDGRFRHLPPASGQLCVCTSSSMCAKSRLLGSFLFGRGSHLRLCEGPLGGQRRPFGCARTKCSTIYICRSSCCPAQLCRATAPPYLEIIIVSTYCWSERRAAEKEWRHEHNVGLTLSSTSSILDGRWRRRNEIASPFVCVFFFFFFSDFFFSLPHGWLLPFFCLFLNTLRQIFFGFSFLSFSGC
jgi:hypothetical protein